MPLDLNGDAVRAALMSRMSEQGTDSADAPEKKGVGLAPYAALIGGSAADAITTADALKSGRGREGNPAMVGKDIKAILLQKLLSTAGLGYGMHAMGKSHPKLAKGIGYVGGAALGAIAAHNTRVGR